MKNTKTCPKCNSKIILRKDGGTGKYGGGNIIHTGITAFSYVNVNRYICADCGYTEEWIDKKDLQKLEKSVWTKRVK